MKNLMRVIVLAVLSVFMVSCAYNDSNLKNDPNARIHQISQLTPLSIPADAGILFLNNDFIVYCRDVDNMNNSERPYTEIFQHNISSNESALIGKVFLPDPASRALSAVKDDMLYLICTNEDQTKSEIREFDLTANTSRVITQWNRRCVFSYLYIMNDHIIHFDISYGDPDPSTTDYIIESINLTDLSVKTLVKKHYDRHNQAIYHTGISCIAVDPDTDHIYTYQVYNSEYAEFKIVIYNLDGETVSEYPLDLSGFITIDANNNSDDSVFRIYSVNDYIILHTLNRRTQIMHQTGTGLLPIAAPEDFIGYRPIGNYQIIEDFGRDNNIYFSDSINTQASSIYVFDTDTGEFALCPVFNETDYYHYYYRNRDTLLIQETQMNDIHDTTYYITEF